MSEKPIGFVRHNEAGEIVFRQAGHPDNDAYLEPAWYPVWLRPSPVAIQTTGRVVVTEAEAARSEACRLLSRTGSSTGPPAELAIASAQVWATLAVSYELAGME